jgi:hypothetical protein
MYFDCHRHWLPRKYKFRQEQNTFRKDTIIIKGPPKMEGTNILSKCLLYIYVNQHAFILFHKILI